MTGYNDRQERIRFDNCAVIFDKRSSGNLFCLLFRFSSFSETHRLRSKSWDSPNLSPPAYHVDLAGFVQQQSSTMSDSERLASVAVYDSVSC